MKAPWLIAILAAAPAAAPLAQLGGKPLPPSALVSSDVNMFIELHNHLQAASIGSDENIPEYRSEVQAYRDAKELAKDPRVWQIVNDACIKGPDIAAIAATATSLPSELPAPDQEAARKMLGALVSAWPRFESGDAADRGRSLQGVRSKVLVRHWGMVQERLLTTLYEKFAFLPPDAPIVVYPVIEPVQVGVWGKTAKGYYIVLPVARMANLVILEQLLHEVTHVVDEAQPAGSSSVLARLRRQAAGADSESLERLLHGLVTWNAGELIRRAVSADYKTLVEISPDVRKPLETYLPTYQGPWAAYLDGKISADQAIQGMAGALKPAATPAPPASES